jgi:hypothetical protein
MKNGMPREYVFERRAEAFQFLKAMGYKKRPRQHYVKVFADGYFAGIRPTASRAGSTAFACGIGYAPFTVARALASRGVSALVDSLDLNLFTFERGDRPFSAECFGSKGYIKYNDDLFDEFVEDAALMDKYLTANANKAGVLRMFDVHNAYTQGGGGVHVASNLAFYLASIGQLERASAEFKNLRGGVLQVDYEDQEVGWLQLLRSRSRFLDLYFDTTFPAELDPRRR